MQIKTFTTGRIKKADYDCASRQLDLHWDNKTVQAYKHVPQEVYRRLCSVTRQPSVPAFWRANFMILEAGQTRSKNRRCR